MTGDTMVFGPPTLQAAIATRSAGLRMPSRPPVGSQRYLIEWLGGAAGFAARFVEDDLRVQENFGGDYRRRSWLDDDTSDFVPNSEQGGSGGLHFPLPFRPAFFHHFGNTTTRIGRHPAPAPRTASARPPTPTFQWSVALKC